MTATIRHAAAIDFEPIAAITNHYIINTAIHFGFDPVTAAELRASWEKGKDKHPYLVSVNEHGEVVAYAKAGVWRERAAYGATAETGIYVRHDLCGRGLGKPLYLRLIDECRGAGLHTLVAGIATPNPGSIRLHESCGFTHVGTFRQVGRKFDAWHDATFMQLML